MHIIFHHFSHFPILPFLHRILISQSLNIYMFIGKDYIKGYNHHSVTSGARYLRYWPKRPQNFSSAPRTSRRTPGTKNFVGRELVCANPSPTPNSCFPPTIKTKPCLLKLKKMSVMIKSMCNDFRSRLAGWNPLTFIFLYVYKLKIESMYMHKSQS